MYHNEAQKETMPQDGVTSRAKTQLRGYRARKYRPAATPLDRALPE